MDRVGEREVLENDLAALEVLSRLAMYGAYVSNHDKPTDEEKELLEAYSDGAGAFEPSAVVAWVEARILETENSLDALSRGLPEPWQEAGVVLSAGIVAAARVVDCWESGNLDEAVRELQEWRLDAVEAFKALPGGAR